MKDPPFIFLCIFPPLCLFAAFPLNRIVVFLSCPGSRYCLTKYFMVHSTPYLPTVSYLLSEIKGSFFGGGGGKEIAGLFYCFYVKVSPVHQTHRNTAALPVAPFMRPGHGWPFIYLFAGLFIYRRRGPAYDFQLLFPRSFPSYLFKREKFKAAVSAEGEAC